MNTCLAASRPRGVATLRDRSDGAYEGTHTTRFASILVCLVLGVGLSGCTLSPDGAQAERAKLDEAGLTLETPIERRSVPELPEAPSWRNVLRRAFLANGDLEAAYFQWKAAMQRVDAASAYPNANVSLGFDYMFSGDRMKSFDRATFSAGFDPEMNLTLPVKVEQEAKLALSEARAAGERFRVAKFELQRKVLRAWADYAVQSRVIELRRQDLALRRAMVEAAARSAGAGTPLREVQAADLELRMSENELLELRSQHEGARAALNALLGRDAGATLIVAGPMPQVRSLPADDAAMLRAAADVFPEVALMAREVEGRADALELARLRWIPDLSPTASITGTISQALGAMITLPTTASAIRAGIREAEANLRAAKALLRQRSSDRVAEYVALLVMYRDAQRQHEFLRASLLPAATRLAETDARAYEAGAGSFAQIIDSRRSILKVYELIAAAHAEMDKVVVEIECCLGIDIETLGDGAPGQAPANDASRPSSTPQPDPAKEATHVH
ncbi:MAG: TolC family protein [Phycisphaerales bacterium]|jgi:cobalt-zinc-cadmium efflux system outer membrane protein|nr:TolC family protein [Phycisphaerales bacterium]